MQYLGTTVRALLIVFAIAAFVCSSCSCLQPLRYEWGNYTAAESGWGAINCERGYIRVATWIPSGAPHAPTQRDVLYIGVGGLYVLVQELGPGEYLDSAGVHRVPPTVHLFLSMPGMLVAAACGAYPGIRLLLYRWRRAARLRRGVCLKCGYDLRGLVRSRCPECGTGASTRGK